jgi:hypothetical protein
VGDSSTDLPKSLIPDMRARTEAALVERFESSRKTATEGSNNSKFLLVRNDATWHRLEDDMGAVEIKTNGEWTLAGLRV